MSNEDVTPLPARILLQVREGKNYNLLADFTLSVKNSREEGGVTTHDAAVEDIIVGLATALRGQITQLVEGDTGGAWAAWVNSLLESLKWTEDLNGEAA